MTDEAKKPGRTPLPEGEARSCKFDVTIRPAELERLKEVAVADGRTVSDWAHRLVMRELALHPPPECGGCADEENAGGVAYPSHDGSRYCESGSIASGGQNAHCTCDVCF